MGNNLTPDMIAKLAENDNIVGLMQSQVDLGQLVEVIRLVGDEFSVCTGIDSQFYAALSVGAKGIFSTAATICPGLMVELYELTTSGEAEKGLELHNLLQELNRFLEYDPGYVSPAKEALKLMGLPGGRIRRPTPELTEQERSGLRGALRSLELILA
jgi:4-hydroxy-tetrahydrodipicolinate synthase